MVEWPMLTGGMLAHALTYYCSLNLYSIHNPFFMEPHLLLIEILGIWMLLSVSRARRCLDCHFQCGDQPLLRLRYVSAQCTHRPAGRPAQLCPLHAVVHTGPLANRDIAMRLAFRAVTTVLAPTL